MGVFAGRCVYRFRGWDHRIVFSCQGFRPVIRAGGVTLQAVSNARCLSVSSVVCTTVPAGPARVTAAIRDSSVLMVFQVSGGLLSDPGEQQCQPADQHMGPDPGFQAVEHRA